MKNKIILIILGLVVIGISLFIFWPKAETANNTDEKTENQKYEYVDIDAKEAYKLINDNKDIVIIDVSPRYDAGHIPNSLNYYVGDGSLDKAITTLDKDSTYLVYCHVDSASLLGARKLINAGFSNVYRLRGNYPLWLDGGFPIEVGMKSVGEYQGSGIATRSYLEGEFNHTVIADLEDLQSGKFYEGWLVNGSSFFSTGKLIKIDGKYVLDCTTKDDQRKYKEIVITEETEKNGLDNKPETHVLEGEFE